MTNSMPILNITHEELRNRLYHLSVLNEQQRKTIFDCIEKLNASDNWYPKHFHDELKKLDEQGILSNFERAAVEKEFFPT